jgi:hypothetical protein
MGSGRWGSGRRKVEQMLRLDIAQLLRQAQGLSHAALIRVGWPSGASISIVRSAAGLKLVYRTRLEEGAWQKVETHVRLDTTPTQFGSQRQWFRCPTCNRRCRILYGGPQFGCRHCHRLRYSSQSETKADRATRGMFKIIKRLEPRQNFNELPSKPKGMHWRTYKRLVGRYERYGAQWGF